MRSVFLGIAILACVPVAALSKDVAEDGPAWTGLAKDGRLLYARDEFGNRLPDFSKCGFKEGRAAIPDVPVKATVRPGNGDDRAAIQEAIDRVSILPPDEHGYRGAVLLKAGVYYLSDGVQLSQSGVVLRGAGAGENGTVLRATARKKHTLISISGAESSPQAIGPVHDVTDSYVPVGSVSVTLKDTSELKVGDGVMVVRPSTSDWIKTLGMDQLANPWKAGDRDLSWERVIVGIEGQTVFLNAPITTALESRFGGGTLRKYTWRERVENCGVESIRGVSDKDGTPTDENHGWIFIGVQRATDCWVRNVAAQHFGYASVAITDNSRSISVLNSECIDPVSEVTGGRRYGFYLDDSQLCLVQGCRNRNDRHQFVTGSNTCGPNAFVDGISESAKSDAGPHHRWANGILWDSIVLKGGELNARNRGNSGSGHGWAGANCVFWNCRAAGFIVENPPTARNWCIGGIGAIRQGKGFVGPHDPGTLQSHGAPVSPASLFAAQRNDARRGKVVQTREYIVGRFDGLTGDDPVFVDADWKGEVAKLGTISGFNRVESNGVVPWTHRFGVGSGERILSASLSVCIRQEKKDRAVPGAVYLGGVDGRRSLDDASLRTEWPGATVLCYDLNDLGALERGVLNVAAANGVAVDWAVLELAIDAGEKPTLPPEGGNALTR